MARRRTAIASVTWRDGVHLTDTSIWCDALRRRDVCFVSSADRVGRTAHGQLIGTPLTLALLGADAGGNLAVPLRQRFTLGTLRLELIASGRGPGAAALYVDRAGRKTLYAGPVRTAEGAGEIAEVRTCETLVVAAPYGDSTHRFPSLANAVARTLAWVRAQLEAGRRPVLLVGSALDGLEVATVLAREGLAVAGGRPIREVARRAATLSIATPGRDPRPVIWLAADPTGLARALGDHRRSIARLDARATTDGVDAAFAWQAAADRPQLLAWIEATRAKEVYVTGACAETIVKALGDRGRVLGPPQQLVLFPDRARPRDKAARGSR